MITTKDIDVDLEKDKVNLNQKTTKDIDVGFKPVEAKKVTKPKKVTRPRSISTHTMQDIADILDKKKRDDIMAEQKLAMKDEKKIVIVEKEVEIITAPTIVKDGEGTPVRLDEIGSPAIEVDEEKKPWKEMTDDEKKIEMKRRAVKAKATRARKKEELK